MQSIDSLNHDDFDCVITPNADLSSSTVAEEMPRFLSELDEKAGEKVLLDLTANKTIDSQGISLVVGLHKECVKQQRNLRIASSSPLIVKVFQMMQLDKHLDMVRVG